MVRAPTGVEAGGRCQALQHLKKTLEVGTYQVKNGKKEVTQQPDSQLIIAR